MRKNYWKDLSEEERTAMIEKQRAAKTSKLFSVDMGDGWEIRRIDELNYVIRENGKRPFSEEHYFGSVVSAVRYMEEHRLGNAARRNDVDSETKKILSAINHLAGIGSSPCVSPEQENGEVA